MISEKEQYFPSPNDSIETFQICRWTLIMLMMNNGVAFDVFKIILICDACEILV